MSDRKISILHIASDEKFINAANYIFEKAFPDCNHFIIPQSRFNRNLVYVKITQNIEVVHYGNNLVRLLSERTEKYDCVILHGITELNSSVFLSSQNKHKFIGILWGAELYTEENFPERSLKGELTAAIDLPEPELSIRERIKNILRRLVYHKNTSIMDATKLATRELNFFSVPYEEEFFLFKDRKMISENCQLIPFTYYPLEFIVKGNESSIINGNDILIGNSASFTNNHLEAFQIINNIDIDNRKIVVPLSYGSSIYADFIQAKGIELFNGNFKALRKFMALDEFTREMQRCGISIMNHYRQQAVGSILTMLWLGSKVYLNESNTIFHFLKRIGIVVFSIEKDLTKYNPLALNNLPPNEIEHNKAVLKNAIGEEHIIESLKEGICKNFQ